MPAEPLYPLSFEPILKDLIWGGERLATLLGKARLPGGRCAESWEISDHRDDVSRVRNGPLAGATLRDLIRERGDELLGIGRSPTKPDQFPLLVKFLDAREVLSVQVHPDDVQGRRLANDNGKTEAWVIVHADPGSLIYAGLKPDVSRDAFAAALGTPDVEPLLHRFLARAGDCIMIPAGTVHAIGAGVVLAEIQQMSDATFRVHDWGRVGPDGKPRALHLAEALEATDFERGPVDPLVAEPEPLPGGKWEALAACNYFRLTRLLLNGQSMIGLTDRFTIVLGLGGAAEVRHNGESFPIEFGETLLLPAALGPCVVIPRDHEATLLTCVVP
jgi:mannose-6-phosphate isomerase